MARTYGLTKREAQICHLLAEGKTSATIQAELFLTKSTVNTHRYHIYQKVGVGSQQELIKKVKDQEQKQFSV